jgi:hypothetical protein
MAEVAANANAVPTNNASVRFIAFLPVERAFLVRHQATQPRRAACDPNNPLGTQR